MQCKVEAFWDGEAKVWVATSDDIPGLATEANSLETLTKKLHNMIPELMIANGIIPSNYTGKISLELLTHRQELIEVC